MQFTDQDISDVVFLGNTLGALFVHEPTSKQGRALTGQIVALNVDEAAKAWPYVSDEQAREALGGMIRACVSFPCLEPSVSERELEDMTWEYRRLFVGPQAKIAPPWGSVYMDYDQVIFGKTTLELKSWIREHGVVSPTDGTQPEDHFGLMMELMAWIAEHKPECLEEFLRLHLLTWSDHFLDIVERETTHDFYRGLAELTRASMEGLRVHFEISVTTPIFYR